VLIYFIESRLNIDVRKNESACKLSSAWSLLQATCIMINEKRSNIAKLIVPQSLERETNFCADIQNIIHLRFQFPQGVPWRGRI